MLTTGSRLGPYEITGSLGAGGMGQVYRVRDTTLHRDVAEPSMAAAAGGTSAGHARRI